MRACALAFQDLGWRVWFGGECPGTGGAMVRLGPAPPPTNTRPTLCPMLKVEISIVVF